MSKIFVVEPFKMLQQALVFALASEHQVQVADQLPPLESAPEADAVVIDGAALAGKGGSQPALGALRDWQIPIIWLGAESPATVSTPGRFVSLPLPLERESLRKSLADVLAAERATQTAALNSPPAPASAAEQLKRKKTESRQSGGRDRLGIIELVEVVEERSPGALDKSDVKAEN